MKIRKGNMWDEFNNSDYFIITTNSFIKQDGCLVMEQVLPVISTLPDNVRVWIF